MYSFFLKQLSHAILSAFCKKRKAFTEPFQPLTLLVNFIKPDLLAVDVQEELASANVVLAIA